MILKIQLKKVFRNKRFLFFTIIMPAIWYALMIYASTHGNYNHENTLNKYIIFIIACLIGIIGNSIITFAGRVSGSIKFYNLQNNITNYSIWSFLKDYLTTQIILNLLITFILLIIGIFSKAITLNIIIILIIVLTTIIGIYSSIIGFFIGIMLDKKTITASSFPITLIVGCLFVPFKQMLSGYFVNIIDIIQRIFPLYYVIDISNEIINNKSMLKSFSMFIITIIVTLIPILITIWFKFIKKGVA
ncbi:lantibiotic ABC transporter permease [Apilactobacillus micheneri]|uniref:lantibiotic ABC transporter permease n=1 Tax=Apilactobacillus micheneri TaxID=1899430 RepID=UPI00112AF092|nr:lantibiotic ABC transporter permease [Apilactobacillus micheneri]TPR42951.1 lantibiotic ABC transporter permease [Apilactobacillus micheneri]TPR47282.1 lantibiotic ABC transporter permease [Apilactobacillus micheneri]